MAAKKQTHALYLAFLLLVELTAVPPARAALTVGQTNDRARKALNLAKVSAGLFQRIRKSDNGIPDNVLKEAKAVAVFPAVVRSGGLFGSNSKGKGVIS